jgi:energy-coupling factor transporter transmembrane protein EcfT
MALGAIILLILEGLSIATISRESAFILFFALTSALLRLLGRDTIHFEPMAFISDSAIYLIKLLSAFLMGRLLYASMSLSELCDALTGIVRRIPILRRFDIGLGVSLVLGYIPLIFSEWRGSLEAARSRGLPKRPKLFQQASFLSAFLRRLMLSAVAVPEALIARGWNRKRGIAPINWKLRDTIVLLISCFCFGIALLRVV